MRVVQFGVGGWGKNHLRILSELDVLIAVCDPSSIAKQMMLDKYKGIMYHKTIDEILQYEDFDTAFVCTPTKTHYSITSILLKAGKNVFVEKPLTYNPEEGKKLIELARSNNVILSCGYIERFNPAIIETKRTIDKKLYGKLLMLEFHRENKLPPNHKDVGIIHDTLVHDIDTANYLFKEYPLKITSTGGSHYATIILHYSKNRHAAITGNWVTPNKVRTFSAVCEKGIINGDFITQKISMSSESKTITPHLKRAEPLYNEIKSFLGAVNGDNKLVVSPEDAVEVSRIAYEAIN